MRRAVVRQNLENYILSEERSILAVSWVEEKITIVPEQMEINEIKTSVIQGKVRD